MHFKIKILFFIFFQSHFPWGNDFNFHEMILIASVSGVQDSARLHIATNPSLIHTHTHIRLRLLAFFHFHSWNSHKNCRRLVRTLAAPSFATLRLQPNFQLSSVYFDSSARSDGNNSRLEKKIVDIFFAQISMNFWLLAVVEVHQEKKWTANSTDRDRLKKS